MFDKYFVTCNVAVALKLIGYDEPCMATWEYYNHKGAAHSKLIIGYSNQPTTPEIYNATIQQALTERPGLFVERRNNASLAQWQYAAPLYEQVFEWLLAKGYYLHPYRVPKFNELPARWGVNVFDDKGNLIWPEITLYDQQAGRRKDCLYEDRLTALRHGTLAAIKLLREQGN